MDIWTTKSKKGQSSAIGPLEKRLYILIFHAIQFFTSLLHPLTVYVHSHRTSLKNFKRNKRYQKTKEVILVRIRPTRKNTLVIYIINTCIYKNSKGPSKFLFDTKIRKLPIFSISHELQIKFMELEYIYFNFLKFP